VPNPKLTLTFPTAPDWSPSPSANLDEPVIVPTTETILSSNYPDRDWLLVPLTSTHSQLAVNLYEASWSQAEVHAALIANVAPPRADLPGVLNGEPMTLTGLVAYFSNPTPHQWTIYDILTGLQLESLELIQTFNPTLHLQFVLGRPSLTPLNYKKLKEVLL
jgi:hypothetical protein